MKTLIASFVLLFGLSTHADDMQKYLKETQAMMRDGKHEEALKRFIWFHEHALEHDKAMYGVRLSFALSYWKSLGGVYPPAQEAMVKLRDENDKLLREGKGSRSLFHDLVALNRTLGAEKGSVELFEAISKAEPAKGKDYWSVVKDVVLGQKRYDLAKAYMQDLEAEFEKVKAMYDQNLALYDNPQMGGKQFQDYNEGRFVKDVKELIALSVALADNDAAEAIRDKALKVLNDPRLQRTPEGAVAK